MNKNLIRGRFYEGERPLYGTKNLRLQDIRFYPGESALKKSPDIEVSDYYFMGKYPFGIKNSPFTFYSRDAIWYSKNTRMISSVVEAPKIFREVALS